jgi:hypothetical protein
VSIGDIKWHLVATVSAQDSWLARTFTDGLLVIHGGEAVVKRYAGMMAETDRHLLMSISTP